MVKLCNLDLQICFMETLKSKMVNFANFKHTSYVLYTLNTISTIDLLECITQFHSYYLFVDFSEELPHHVF